MLLRRFLVLQLVAVGLAMGGAAAWVAPAFAQGTDYTWTGADLTPAPGWSFPGNWTDDSGQPATPTNPVGTLTFPPHLPPCTSCYSSADDISGLSVDGIQIADDEPYALSDLQPILDPLSIGAQGITGTSSGAGAGPASLSSFAINLTDPQTWSVDQGELDFTEGSTATGPGIPLTIELTDGGTLKLLQASDIEAGPISVGGNGVLDINSSQLNATLGGQITEQPGATILVENHATTGPLIAGGTVELGQPGTPAALTVNGDASLTGTLGVSIAQAVAAGGAASTLTATGNVDLTGATLDLTQTYESADTSCLSLNAGDVYALVSASSVTGTFAGVPDGTTFEITPECASSGQTYYAEITYTPVAVTATILGAIPLNSSTPQIDGTLAVGQTLTADPGAWNPPATGTTPYAYQWEDCDASGASCTPISGATGQTYTVQPGDVGDALLVVVTATNDFGASPPTSSLLTGLVPAPAPQPPANVQPPAIAGTLLAGQTLSATTGSWTGNVDTYGYQWEDCDAQGAGCQAIAGATGSTYQLTAGDAGHTIIVAVTATAAGLSSQAAPSAPTPAVQAASAAAVAPGDTGPPRLKGTIAVGGSLSADPGTWTGTAPIGVSYVWERCHHKCEPIPGATAATYTLTHADAGDLITVVVIATNAGGTGKATAALVGPIKTGVFAPPKAVSKALYRKLAKLLWPRGKASSRAALLKAGGYPFRWRAPFTGRLLLRWQVKVGRREIRVGTATSKWRAGHGGRIEVKLTAAGRRRFEKGPARVIVLAEFAPLDDAYVGLRSWFELP